MSYTKHAWVTGETITEEKLNNIEDGVDNVSRHLSDLEDTVSTTQIINTASGAIASFSDGADSMPIKKLVAQIEPVQDLHGYDNPWPAGGGKNLFYPTQRTATSKGITYQTNEDGSITLTGTATGEEFFTIIVGDTSFFPSPLSISATGGTSDIALFIGGTAINCANGTATVETEIAKSSARLRVPEGAVTNCTVKIQAENSTTIPTEWTPYSNICPISGHTGMTVNRTSVNMWDEEWEVGQYRPNTGEKTDNSNNIRSKNFIPCKPNTTYCFVWDGWSAWSEQVLFYDADYSFITGANKSFALLPATFTTPATAYYMTFFAAGASTYNNNISINYPATDTAYHAYTGTTIPVTWQTEAGTVYGGTLDLVTGELTVDRNVVQIPTDYWSYNSNLALFWSVKNNNPVLANLAGPIVGGYDVICSAYKHFNGTRYADIVDGEFSVGLYNYSSQAPYVIVKDTRFTTLEDFKANSGIENVSFEIPLATPLVYQLDPVTVQTLLGNNTVYVDCGSVTVDYPADTRKYIDNKIATAVANALNA